MSKIEISVLAKGFMYEDIQSYKSAKNISELI